MLWATGRALTNVSCDTAVTAFGAVWFTYTILVTLLLTTVVLLLITVVL